MKRFVSRIAAVLLMVAASALAPPAASAVTIPTVPVGNAGNSNDPADGDWITDGIQNFGAVPYAYNIGTTEVTNTQYAAFLNAKAASDPLGLYNTLMGEVANHGGIARSGSSPNFSYAAISGRGDNPVNQVSWYDSIRFANWLNNGQGSGDTETGAYTLGELWIDDPNFPDGTPVNGDSITRNAGATWFLTSENEWYKAAYHKNDGITSDYFEYATSSDTEPTAEAPPGGSNSVNSGGKVGDLTDVGAYTASDSPYGTFDQAGNVFEWNEALINGSRRGQRGSAFNFAPFFLPKSARSHDDPTAGSHYQGFRVASVPEPSSGVLAVVACGLMWWWRKRFN